MAKIRIGVDTGGTFTDFVIIQNGKTIIKKIPSTPEDPSRAILAGIEKYFDRKINPLIIHGTTVATNALLEKRGGKVALLTTKGFEDIIFIGRQNRHKLYSLRGEQSTPLLPRRCCFGLEERTTAEGIVESRVSSSELSLIVDKIRRSRAEAVAVSLINSYANPQNERAILKSLEREGFFTTLSTEILPEHREYERTIITVINAFLLPVISHYLKSLEKKLNPIHLRIMQSNEGYISSATARSEPIRTALSGPAGGVVAAQYVARAAGFKHIITFDMGGTSSDVSMIDNQIRRTNESFIGEFPVRIPMIDIHTVGAGGGSIAYFDRGGSLRVGPQSAGANPGPACYGKTLFPTVTDANLVLGRLAPELFLGGEIPLFPRRSRKALKILSQSIGKTILETAEGIIAIANANMEKAIRVISIERGIDPRNFVLFSFGGAGGMHSVEIASHLNIRRIIVPYNAGVLSAMGLLLADSVKDYSRSILMTSDKVLTKSLSSSFQELSEQGTKEMIKEGFNHKNIRFKYALDLRYLGQSHEIMLPYREGKSFLSGFHKTHKKLYSYNHPEQPVEIVNLRVKAIGLSHKINLKKLPQQGKTPTGLIKSQDLYFRGKKFRASVFDRTRLKPGNIIRGPALVSDYESTTFLPPAYALLVDGYLNLVIQEDRKK